MIVQIVATILMFAPWARAADRDDGCSLTPPDGGYLVAIGYGDGSRAEALREARADAHERLLGQVCSGYTTNRCERVGRFVRDWEQGEWDATSRHVCAIAALEIQHLEALERGTEALRADLDAMASVVLDHAGDAPLVVESPTWATEGCGAGAAGAVLAAELRNALARGGARVLLQDVQTAAPSVRLSLTSSERGVVLSGALALAGRPDGVALPGTRASWDVLGVQPATPCADAATTAPPARVVPARGTVVVDGRELEETHWIGGCVEPDESQRAAMGLWGSLDGPGSSGDAAALAVVVQGYLAESRALCERYERFAIGADEYARRSAELSDWFHRVQETVLAGGGTSAADNDLLSGPSAAEDRALDVQAERLDGSLLTSGDVVRRDDRFKLYATVDQPAHLYVIYENSAGEVAIFPESPQGVHGEPGRPIQLPAPGFVFRVDEHAGRVEVVHVVASPHPLPVHARPVGAIVGNVRRTRGLSVEPETVFTSDGEQPWYGDPEATVHGYGALLYTLVLDHR